MQLYSLIELDQLQQELSCLTETKRWVEDFLAKPHPELGRSGSVCPFIPKALQKNTIRFTVIWAKDLAHQRLEDVVQHCRDVFLELEPKTGELAFYKALMLIFPDIPAKEASEMVDDVQKKMKPFFVEAGLMLGEFHQWNESPGLHNPAFRPLRSPIPMLAIRFMSELDLPFLDRMTDEPSVRVRYLEAYLHRLGKTLKDEKKLDHAREALKLTRAELGQASVESVPQSKCPFAPLIGFFRRMKLHLQGNR